MAAILGFRILEPLYDSARTRVLRAVREQDELPVVLKIRKDDALTTQELGQYLQEYEILRSLQGVPGVVKTYGIERSSSGVMILFEDFGGLNLQRIFSGAPGEVSRVLELAIEIAVSLAGIHDAQVIHKDINPTNIVANPGTGQLRIIDFGIASQLPRERPRLTNPRVLEGTIGYISPEQTGRMNRSLDYRSDYYSLGITLYELLTGYPPFTSEDLVEMLHCHLAQIPRSPREIRPEIPQALSDIVMKLVAKDPESRYQTAHGLAADLERCQKSLSLPDAALVFPLGQNDVAERLILPQKLYGRGTETSALLLSFDRVARGGREMVVVSGRSGVGKTALVQELHRPITERRGFYIQGKFDRLKGTPYTGLVDACRQLMRYLILEPKPSLDRWRLTLAQALGPSARLIIDLVPELEHIIGPRSTDVGLASAELKSRFNLCFEKFIGVLAGPSHPLVMFLDDLQWADLGSLRLILHLMLSTEIEGLLLIGAYRENEVDASHPLAQTLGGMEIAGVGLTRIPLHELTLADVRQMLVDALRAPREVIAPLAELVLDKTAGNPFFVGEFLASMSKKGFLSFARKSGAWEWNLDTLQSQTITDNVADLLAERVGELPGETQKALAHAAALGNQFDLGTLATVLSEDPKNTGSALMPALRVGLVTPIGDGYRGMLLDTEPARAFRVEFRFVHDRVQAASYALIPVGQQKRLHARIGTLLLTRGSEEDRKAHLFEIVNYLQLGLETLSSPEERLSLTRLELEAGQRAKAAGAFEQALHHLEAGWQLLGEDRWESQYELTYALCAELAEATYLNAEFERTRALTEELVEHARTLLSRVKGYELRIVSFTAQGRMQDAVRVALMTLDLLGFHLPPKPSRRKVIGSFLLVKLGLLGRDLDRLQERPKLADARLAAAIRVMRSIATASYWSDPNLCALLIFRQIRMMLGHGFNEWSCSSFASLGLMLCGVIGDHQLGYRMGELALLLLDRYQAEDKRCRTMFLFNWGVRHWQEPLSCTIAPLKEGYELGLQSGDVEYAALSIAWSHIHALFSGNSLVELEHSLSDYTSPVRRINQAMPWVALSTLHQLTWNLANPTDQPWVLTGAFCEQAEALQQFEHGANESGLFFVEVLLLLLDCWFERYDEGVELSAAMEKSLHAVDGLFMQRIFLSYQSLCCLGRFPRVGAAEQAAILRKVKMNQRRVQKWLSRCPGNQAHLFHLVEAKGFAVRGKKDKAIEHFERAIKLSRDHGFTHEEGLCCELAGAYYLKLDFAEQGMSKLRDAHFAYLKWGGSTKERALEQKYETLRVRARPPSLEAVSSSRTALLNRDGAVRAPLLTGSAAASGAIDFESVIKATQTLSGRIVLNELLDTLIRTAIENAGAELGALVFENEGRLLVEARLDLRRDQKVAVESLPLEACADVSPGIVWYVFRSREPVVLADAAAAHNFGSDQHVQEQRCRSVLCIPILRNNQAVGVLYLENNQACGVFSSDRVAALEVISSQAAISIENARLYKQLEEALAKAKESGRLKDEFLAKTSHELRTPLNSIINLPMGLLGDIQIQERARCRGCGTTFELEEGDRVDGQTRCPECGREGLLELTMTKFLMTPIDELENYLKIIVNQGRHLLEVVNDVLDLSSLADGRISLKLEEVLVKEAISQVVKLVRYQAKQRSTEITVPEVPADLRLVVDRERLIQILGNLLVNAIKFSPAEGQVGIGVEPGPEQLTFWVKDHGIGIAKEDLGLIFDGFRQVEGGATRRYGGLGLGLAITRNLVEMHHGDIWVESELGQGSTFFVRLPRKPPAQPEGA